jgi:hypothetical protein
MRGDALALVENLDVRAVKRASTSARTKRCGTL